jgi:filamin
VSVNGADVTGSPFTVRVFNPERILVGKIPDGVVNKPVHFTVDASEAGVGNLEVIYKLNIIKVITRLR